MASRLQTMSVRLALVLVAIGLVSETAHGVCETAYVAGGSWLCNLTLATQVTQCTDITSYVPEGVYKINGFAQHPVTNEYYIYLRNTGDNVRSLYKFNVTGFSSSSRTYTFGSNSFTLIESYSSVRFSGITFGGCSDGNITLYGITGVIESDQNLYAIDTDTGALTFLADLKDTDNRKGANIAYSPFDRQIYKFIGFVGSSEELSAVDTISQTFEETKVYSVGNAFPYDRVQGLGVYDQNYILLIDYENNLFKININNKTDYKQLFTVSFGSNTKAILCADLTQNDNFVCHLHSTNIPSAQPPQQPTLPTMQPTNLTTGPESTESNPDATESDASEPTEHPVLQPSVMPTFLKMQSTSVPIDPNAGSIPDENDTNTNRSTRDDDGLFGLGPNWWIYLSAAGGALLMLLLGICGTCYKCKQRKKHKPPLDKASIRSVTPSVRNVPRNLRSLSGLSGMSGLADVPTDGTPSQAIQMVSTPTTPNENVAVSIGVASEEGSDGIIVTRTHPAVYTVPLSPSTTGGLPKLNSIENVDIEESDDNVPAAPALPVTGSVQSFGTASPADTVATGTVAMDAMGPRDGDLVTGSSVANAARITSVTSVTSVASVMSVASVQSSRGLPLLSGDMASTAPEDNDNILGADGMDGDDAGDEALVEGGNESSSSSEDGDAMYNDTNDASAKATNDNDGDGAETTRNKVATPGRGKQKGKRIRKARTSQKIVKKEEGDKVTEEGG